jgi:hypothetical protein
VNQTPDKLISEKCLPFNLKLTVHTGLGLNIVGGREQSSPLIVSRLLPGGPAERDGRVCVGDHLLAVNGTSVQGESHRKAVHLLRAACSGCQGDRVIRLLLLRPTCERCSDHSDPSNVECPRTTRIASDRDCAPDSRCHATEPARSRRCRTRRTAR